MNDQSTVDPRLIQVTAARNNLERGEGALHRHDEDHQCDRAPSNPQSSTDLVTAAVANEVPGKGDHSLCSYCEWPDGAEEVLHGN